MVELVTKVRQYIGTNEAKECQLLNISTEDDIERIILLKLIIYDMNVHKVVKYFYKNTFGLECLGYVTVNSTMYELHEKLTAWIDIIDSCNERDNQIINLQMNMYLYHRQH